MNLEHILLIVMVAIFFSTIFNVGLKKLNMPPILGYIIAGVFISYQFDLQTTNKEILYQIAEFGIVFLLFTIGLEFSINSLKNMIKEVLAHGSLQFIITAGVFFSLAYYKFGIPAKGSIITGAALALSSTAIVLKFIDDRRDTGRAYAKQAIGILLFQDIAVIPILIMIGIFSNGDTNLTSLLLETVFDAIIVLSFLFLVGKYAISRFLKWVVSSHSHEIFISSILLVVVSASYLAHSFGFSYSLGALVAGIMIAETHYKYQIEADLTPFRDILLGVFFVSVGMQINLFFFFDKLADILLLMVFIMVVKAIIIYSILRTTHWHSTATKAAIALSQVGEFSFVIFELARKSQLVSTYYSNFMIIAIVLSMISTPFILRYADFITRLFRKSFKEEDNVADAVNVTLKDHVIVCGYGWHGRKIVENLVNMKIPYIVIEFHKDMVEKGTERGVNVIFGNAAQKSILKKAKIKNAIAVIVAIENEKNAALIAQRVYEVSPQVNLVVKTMDKPAFEAQKNIPITNIVDEHEEIAKILVNYAISCEIDKNS